MLPAPLEPIRTMPMPESGYSRAEPILLVEDDPEIRAVLVECLEDNGFGVIEAADAERAIALLEQGLAPPVVVTDINLGPGWSGLALADRIHEFSPQMPVVFITGRLDMLRDRGVKAHEYLVPKPFPLSALMGVVRRFATADRRSMRLN